VEVLVNILVSLLALLLPAAFCNLLFGISVEITHFGINLSYWYAVLLIVITYIMLKSLLTENLKAMLIVLEAYLLGDILQLLVIFIRLPFGLPLNIGILFTVVFTIFLLITRIMVILKPHLLGFKT
jgi:hypothetical protein